MGEEGWRKQRGKKEVKGGRRGGRVKSGGKRRREKGREEGDERMRRKDG